MLLRRPQSPLQALVGIQGPRADGDFQLHLRNGETEAKGHKAVRGDREEPLPPDHQVSGCGPFHFPIYKSGQK